MSFLKVVAFIALVAAASARPDSGGHGGHAAPAHAAPAHAPAGGYGYTSSSSPPAKPEYSFDWAVKDDYAALDFGQHETRDGYNTEGSYYVLLPDSRVQRVTYTVHGDGGYVATVEYEGEAKHDAYGKPPAPTYTQPPPTDPHPHQPMVMLNLCHEFPKQRPFVL
ncbi:cuticle protein 7-like [Portunus trituberculatus]|uniref:cuticle protein 7-like n=1 Tax=Portunus trituberculatus TaxID=210409 RepID=UPI001E1D03B2|nr:cuticle protein 7-like [Portunus trituberculatus]